MNNYDGKIQNRLKRADGQLQGVLRMMTDNRDCMDVITQLSAVRSSISNLIGVIVAENLKDCLLTGGVDQDEKIDRALRLIVKK